MMHVSKLGEQAQDWERQSTQPGQTETYAIALHRCLWEMASYAFLAASNGGGGEEPADAQSSS